MTIQAMKFASRVLFGALAISLSIRFGVSQVPLRQRKAALKQWYRQDFSLENNPDGLAFDGSNIWVTYANCKSVTKIRAIDGVKLGSFPVGSAASRVLFDGENIWIANGGTNTVTKLRASTGANLGTFRVGSTPLGMAFDGANVWVANRDDTFVTKIRASDGAVLGNFTVGFYHTSIAFDGANMWVASIYGTVTELRASDGATLGTFPAPAAYEIVFDGVNVWIPGFYGSSVTKIRTSDGATIGTFPVVGQYPYVLTFDGDHIWVGSLDGTINKLAASDGRNLETIPGSWGLEGIMFDGANIWTANAGTSVVSKY
jgi:hypothetical protein